MNEEVAREAIQKSVNLMVKISRPIGRRAAALLYQMIKDLLSDGWQNRPAERANKGGLEKLEQIEVRDGQMQIMRRELYKLGVKTSIMSDKQNGSHYMFFQAKDREVMDAAFRVSLKKFEKKAEKWAGKEKPSIGEKMQEISKKIAKSIRRTKERGRER